MEKHVIFRIIRYIFFEDYIAKLICLAIGTGLWFYVEFARVTQTTFNVPIDYVKKPANLYLKQGQARFIKVTVRGRDEFLKFSTSGIKAEVTSPTRAAAKRRILSVSTRGNYPNASSLLRGPKPSPSASKRAVRGLFPYMWSRRAIPMPAGACSK